MADCRWMADRTPAGTALARPRQSACRRPMRLSEFIHDMLYDIALGVEIARARSHGIAAVAPDSINGERVAERTGIDFDVAVVVGGSDTTSKAGDGRVGADIQVATILKAGAGMGGRPSQLPRLLSSRRTASCSRCPST